MKELTKYLLIAAAALCLSACDDKDEPQAPVELEVLPSDIAALTDIYNNLKVYEADYPKPWSPDDPSTWKNAGIELDTLAGGENQPDHLVISAITLYLPREGSLVPKGVRNLSGLKDLKIYGCTGSIIVGTNVPGTVESILIDRLNPDDPGYMEAVHINDRFVLGDISNPRASFSRIVIHGVNMKELYCRYSVHAVLIDLSHNTLETESDAIMTIAQNLNVPVDMSYNKIKSCYWDWYMMTYDVRGNVPDFSHNQVEDIPEKVLKSEFWKDNHEKFIGNPGYVAPEK